MNLPNVAFKPGNVIASESVFVLFTDKDGTQLLRIDYLDAVLISVTPAKWRSPERVELVVHFTNRRARGFVMRDLRQAERASEAIRNCLNKSPK